jgi:hypothetical protein
MLIELSDGRPRRRGKEPAEKIIVDMPGTIGKRFQRHLDRVRDAQTERGRKLRTAEIENTL